MKKIIYTQPDGSVAVVSPCEGARVAHSVRLKDGTILKNDVPTPAFNLIRGMWPRDGVTAEWAETEEEFLTRIARKDVPAGLIYQVVEASAIPTDRTFRAAWRAAEGSVVHDMPACREIQRDRIRERRAPLLAQLDAKFNIELEKLLDKLALSDADKAAAKAIAAKRQALRDAPADAAIDAAKTPEELKAAIPAALTKSA